MPKVSVVIPAYNSAKYLPDAIGSVLQQTYTDFEIIIVDDGSSDNTKEIIEYYMIKHPDKMRYIYQENAGPGAARNRGIVESRSTYLAFLDADDILLKNALADRVSFLDKYTEIPLVFTDYILRNNAKRITEPILHKTGFLKKFNFAIKFQNVNELIFNNKFYKKYIFFRPHPICTDVVMIRKNVFDKFGMFKTNIFTTEDLDLWLRILRVSEVGFINKPTAVYNTYNCSSLMKDEKRRYSNNLKYLLHLYNDKTINQLLLKNKISKGYSDLAYCYFDKYEFDISKKYFICSIRYNFLQLKSYIYVVLLILPQRLIRPLRNIKKRLSLLFVS